MLTLMCFVALAGGGSRGYEIQLTPIQTVQWDQDLELEDIGEDEGEDWVEFDCAEAGYARSEDNAPSPVQRWNE